MHPFWDAFFFGGDGGISTRFASLDCFRQPKILRLRLVFLGRQVLTRWVQIRTKKKKQPSKAENCFFGGDGGIRTHVPG